MIPQSVATQIRLLYCSAEQSHLGLQCMQTAELQIRGGTEDNSRDNFCQFSTKTYVVTPH